MNKYDLIELLSSSDEEDVFLRIDGELYDISNETEYLPESFDGFATAWPAAIALLPKEKEE